MKNDCIRIFESLSAKGIRVKLSSAKFKDTSYGKTNCKYLNSKKKKLINYIQSMLIANYFYNIYE